MERTGERDRRRVPHWEMGVVIRDPTDRARTVPGGRHSS